MKKYVGFNSILAVAPTLMFISMLFSGTKSGIKAFRKYSTAPSILEFEEWMVSLWKLYGRKQPRHYIAN